MSFPDIRRRWLAQARLERFEDVEAALQAKRAQLEAEFTKALAGPDLAALGFRLAALQPEVELIAPDGTVIRFAEVGKYEARDASGQWSRLGSARLRELTSGRVHGLQKLSDLAVRLGQLEQDLARLPDELAAFAGEYRQRLEALDQAVSPQSAEAAQQELEAFFAEHQDELPRCVEQELQKAKHQALLRGLFLPAPPTGLQATSHGSDCIKLIWGASAGAEKYLIYGSEHAPPAEPAFIDSVEASKHEFEWVAAPPGQEFCFYVTAKNAAGESEFGKKPVRGRRTEAGPVPPPPPPPPPIPPEIKLMARRAADEGDVLAVIEIYAREICQKREPWRQSFLTGYLGPAVESRVGTARQTLRSVAEPALAEKLKAEHAGIQRRLQELFDATDDAAAEKAIGDILRSHGAFLKEAEARANRLVEEKRLAEENARQEAEAREAARLAAEAEARRLAEERRKAEEQARAEAEAHRLAEAERLAQEKRLAEEKARQEAEAREAARLAVEAEARRLAEERRKAGEQARAEAEARQVAEAKRLAEEEARQEAEAREAARLAAEAEAKRLADEKRKAEEQATAETEARHLAEEGRVAEEKRLAEEKARLAAAAEAERPAEEERIAEEKAQQEAEAKAEAGPPETPHLATKHTVAQWLKSNQVFVIWPVVVVAAVLVGVLWPKPPPRPVGVPPPRPVGVRVRVMPANAEIYVDRQRVTLDRRRVAQVQPGTRTFEARLAGYETNTANVTVRTGPLMTVNLGTLRSLPVAVTVRVSPTNAALFVNGSQVRPDASGKIELLPGQWEFEARLTGYATKTTGITVAPGKPVAVDLGALERLPATAPKPRLQAHPLASGERWTNSLGMVFAPVPKTEVLFCIWETRVKDYRAYAEANSGVDGSWRDPIYEGVKVTPQDDCPVVMVNWDDAQAFCRWLTQKEREAGLLGPQQSYRLPSDAEWSLAVGLTGETGLTPEDKDMEVKGVYPWGTSWPPPRGAGNYADMTAKRSFSNWPVIEGYDDGYATTAPVGSFTPNPFGLYDMSGNVWEWCEDWWNRQQGARVLRGGSWRGLAPGLHSSSARLSNAPVNRSNRIGFRVVVGASR